MITLLVVVASLVAGVAIGLGVGQVRARRAVADEAAAGAAARAEAQARLDEVEARLERVQRALSAVPQGLVLADESGAIVVRNDAAEEHFTGRPSALLVESTAHDLLAQALTGEAVQRSIELFGPPRRQLILTAVPLGTGQPGSPGAGGALIVVDDVSERLRLDTVRRDFVANISHELKTPVGALGLLAETLLDEADPSVTRRLANRMIHETDRLARTIDDLLELSRIEVEELPEREDVAVGEVLDEAIARTSPGAELAGVVLAAAPVGPEVVVAGDRRQLVSAVANLLDNGVKYSDPGATVHVTAERRASVVEIAVVDEGIGIPARDLERIFERFYRVDRARSRDTGGTGLGLAIVRHIAGNHEGEVLVRSREGEGSTFTLRLPAAPLPATTSAIPAPQIEGAP